MYAIYFKFLHNRNDLRAHFKRKTIFRASNNIFLNLYIRTKLYLYIRAASKCHGIRIAYKHKLPIGTHMNVNMQKVICCVLLVAANIAVCAECQFYRIIFLHVRVLCTILWVCAQENPMLMMPKCLLRYICTNYISCAHTPSI